MNAKPIFRRFLPLLVCLHTAHFAHSADILVDDPSDAGPGTLRQAILDADMNGNDRVIFAAGMDGDIITLTSGEILKSLTAMGSLEIDASNLPHAVTISGNDSSRIFHFSGASSVVMKDLIITHGRAPDGTTSDNFGGGIFSFGALELVHCAVTNNRAGDGAAGNKGGGGGGIFSVGPIILTDSTISENRAGDGSNGAGGNGFTGGQGGGIYASSDLTIQRSIVFGNVAGNGGSADLTKDGGTGGHGGGVYASGSGTETFLIEDSLIRLNIAGSGGPASGTGRGGFGGFGGGIFTDRGTAIVLDDSIKDNTAGSGGGSAGGGERGYGGNGGGIAVSSQGVLNVINSDLTGNRTGLEGPLGIAGGTNGGGGGIHGADGSISTLTNTLIFGSTMAHTGGGVRCDGSDVTLIHCTISGNDAAAGGGGIDGSNGAFFVENSIVAGNTVGGSQVPATANLGNSGATITQTGVNFTAGDPMLDLPGRNGAPGVSMKPMAGSPVIDMALANGNTPATDQRGFIRIFGPAPDIGALEISYQPDNRIGSKKAETTHKGNNVYNGSGAGQRITTKLKKTRKAKSYLSAQNDGDVDSLTLKSGRPNRKVKFKLFQFPFAGGRTNVTAAAKTGGVLLPDLDRGEVVLFQAETKSRSSSIPIRSKSKYRLSSQMAPGLTPDTAVEKLKSAR